jgi:phage shock protein PspC (stress-responsive transcriptional regulator)
MTSSFTDTKLFLSERYKALGGVCSGIALARGFSISLTRLIALLLLQIGFGFLLYLVFWIVLPKASRAGVSEPDALATDPLQRNPDDKFLAGVCSGIAETLRIDASLVRVVSLFLMLCCGVGVLPYLYAWIVIPQRASRKAA